MSTQTLIDTYYSGLARRAGWEAAVSDDFSFTGANAGNGSEGKAAYGEVLRQFGRMFESVSVKHAIVDGDDACVVATYGVVSPSGRKRSFDIAEVWKASSGRLTSLTIFFDTAGWRQFMSD